jgi:hypothetical protein
MVVFSLHCRQQPGTAVFSLIDVSNLEERAFTLHLRQIARMLAFLFLAVNYLEGPSFLLLPSATCLKGLAFTLY